MARLVIVSNRVALPRDRGLKAGGLAVALTEALEEEGGLWFGWSGAVVETAQLEPRTTSAGRIDYATLDLSTTEHETFYSGFANATLWPLFHYRLGLIDFRRAQLHGYIGVNERFARALQPLLAPDDVIWVHDYHFMPMADELRRLGVTNPIGFFLHTPFPAPEVLAATAEAATSDVRTALSTRPVREARRFATVHARSANTTVAVWAMRPRAEKSMPNTCNGAMPTPAPPPDTYPHWNSNC